MSAEMWVAIGAFLSGVGAIIGAILSSMKTIAILNEKMKTVEEKLDEHNGYAKKFADLTEDISSLRTDVAVIRNDISYLKIGK